MRVIAENPTKELVVPELRAALNGRVVMPDDPVYDGARTIFYGGFDRRPAAIVRPGDATDVSRVVKLVREDGVELAVHGGGHSVAGHSTTEGGILLDLRQMKALEIDVERRTAWAQAGLTANEYTVAAGAHGLATGFGDTGSVGIGGLTLGGGMGYLVRKHGLTIDNLLAAEVVTADGEVLHVDAERHPDLFWAIRGGGGNFGVVTKFQYRLQEVSTIVGGLLILPATPDVLDSFIREAEAAPDELSTILNVMPAPPMPFLPQEHHGQLVAMAMLVYAGDVDEGNRAVAPFRALATPIVDMIRPMSYPEVFAFSEGNGHPVGSVRTMFIDAFDQGTAETILDTLRAGTAPMRVAQLRVLGGAMARVPNDATAFAHRDRKILVNIVALNGQPGELAAYEAWTANLAAALSQGNPGAFINFLGNEGEARVRDAYPGSTWDRLVAVKQRYDPGNLFRLNQNIPPAD